MNWGDLEPGDLVIQQSLMDTEVCSWLIVSLERVLRTTDLRISFLDYHGDLYVTYHLGRRPVYCYASESCTTTVLRRGVRIFEWRTS